MEVVAGHFARLEFASSGELTFSFPRELSNLARLVVKRFERRLVSHAQREPNVPNTDNRSLLTDQQRYGCVDQGDGGCDADESSDSLIYRDPKSFDYTQFDDMSDLDMENWSALLPSFSSNSVMDLDWMS